jgi:serine-type D-Ala-D-Ala carboxypeptidase/endopeptidase (penicillin-binding protein 4)
MLLLPFVFASYSAARAIPLAVDRTMFISSTKSKIGYTFILLLASAVALFGQTPTPSPSAANGPAAVRPAVAIRTLEELQAEIRLRLQWPELRRGQVGVKIVSLNTGKVVFDENSEKYFMPASNMKNFTVAAALEKLSPDYRFVTSVYAAAPPDASGTVSGDIRVYGRGDVSLSYSFADGNHYKGLDDLAEKIGAAGVKRIEGSVIADDSYFRGSPIPTGWEWDDLQSYYGAEVSALPLNDNALTLSVTPGPVGYSCSVRLTPSNPVYRVYNKCMTTAAGTPRTLRVEKLLGQNVLEITGDLPLGNSGFNNSITVSRPAELFAALLKQRLEARGIVVTGQYALRPATAAPPVETVEIAKLESPPLSLIAAKTMKPSQNMYTETLLWALGEYARSRTQFPTVGTAAPAPAASASATPAPAAGTPTTSGPPVTAPAQRTSAELGIGEVKGFLTGIGVAPDGILQYDGSGLSRHNLVTPSAVVQLYTYMSKQSKYSQAWRDSLTIGGVDGTLANRFKGTAAQGNIRGKTGTINQVSALSGYLTTAAGEQLVVSFIVNGVPATRDRTSMMDDIVVSLANFNGKID